jgi:hypothetical protein
MTKSTDTAQRSTWGVLSQVSDEERKRLLALPFGQFKPAIKALEKQAKERHKAELTQARTDAARAKTVAAYTNMGNC